MVRIDAERQLLLVKGSVPGYAGRDIIVLPAVKGQKQAGQSKSGQIPPAAKPAAKA